MAFSENGYVCRTKSEVYKALNMKKVILEQVGEIRYIWLMNMACDTCNKFFDTSVEQQVCVVKTNKDDGLVGILLCVDCSKDYKIGEKVQ